MAKMNSTTYQMKLQSLCSNKNKTVKCWDFYCKNSTHEDLTSQDRSYFLELTQNSQTTWLGLYTKI